MVNITNVEACDGCNTCVDNCPVGVLEVDGKVHIADPDMCTDCGICIEVCPNAVLDRGEI